MNPETFLNLARNLTAQLGFPVPVLLSKVMPTPEAMGATVMDPTGATRRFVFSRPYVHILDGEREARDMILHEVAHAMTPNHAHDEVWSAKARELGSAWDTAFVDTKRDMPEYMMRSIENAIDKDYRRWARGDDTTDTARLFMDVYPEAERESWRAELRAKIALRELAEELFGSDF